MIEDKIVLILKDINELKEKLKEIRKDIKIDEQIDTDEYIALKKVLKEAKEQVKDHEEEHRKDLHSDESYNQLRELKIKKEEELAHAYEDLFLNVAKLPQKPFQMNLETENGPVRLQIQPEMRVYVNGKEEKRK